MKSSKPIRAFRSRKIRPKAWQVVSVYRQKATGLIVHRKVLRTKRPVNRWEKFGVNKPLG